MLEFFEMCDDPDGICAICQGSLNDGPTFTIPTCHHEFHTVCLFENYCHGNISCAICRTLPITNLNVDNTLDNIERSYEDINQRDEERFFRKGLVAGRKEGCKSRRLVKAVQRYDAFMTHMKKVQEKERARKKVRQQFVNDCNAAIEKLKNLKRYKKLISDYSANTFKHTISGYKSVAIPEFKKRRKAKRFRARIAEAAGFKPLTVD